jgi:hypothetical protein
MSASMASVGSSLGLQLLYDRTYELFSPRTNTNSFASRYGVWADIAAWYTFLGAFDEMPTAWDESLIKDPLTYRNAYLFMGPRLAYFGYVSSLSVTISHWTLDMVPQRCGIDIGFEIMPDPGTPFWRKQTPVHIENGYWGEYTINPDGSIDKETDLSGFNDPIDFFEGDAPPDGTSIIHPPEFP